MKNFWFYFMLVCCVVALMVGVQKCATDPYKEEPVKKTTTVKRSVSYGPPVKHEVVAKPVLKKTTPAVIPPSAKPSKNYDSLAAQYEKLLAEHYATNEYVDSQDVDSNKIKGYATVKANKLIGLKYDLLLRPKTISTETNTLEERIADPRRQLYFNYGIGAGYTPTTTLWTADVIAGFSYKDRKDRITTLNAAGSTNGQLRGELIMSTKISFRRKK